MVFQGTAGSSSSSKAGNNVTALLDLSFLVSFENTVPTTCILVIGITRVLIIFYVSYQDHLASRMEDYKGDGQKASKMLVKLFPTKIHLQPPQVSIGALTIFWLYISHTFIIIGF